MNCQSILSEIIEKDRHVAAAVRVLRSDRKSIVTIFNLALSFLLVTMFDLALFFSIVTNFNLATIYIVRLFTAFLD